MNKFLSFFKKIFDKKEKLPEPKMNDGESEKSSSGLDGIKFDSSPVCIKKDTKVFTQKTKDGEYEKHFINRDEIYNNGDVYSTEVCDAGSRESFPNFSLKTAYQNYEKALQKIVELRYSNSDEYFSGTPYFIILTQNASEEEVKNWDEVYRGDMQLKESYFERQDDGNYVLKRNVIKSYLKTISENAIISVNGSKKPCYLRLATAEKDGKGEVYTYEQIIELIDKLGMPHSLAEDFESIIQDDYKVPEGSDIRREDIIL